MRRLFFPLLLLAACFTPNGGCLLNHPVPGAWPWYHWEAGPRRPQCAYQDKPVLVVQEEGKAWIAIVGVPPGRARPAPSGDHQRRPHLEFSRSAPNHREATSSSRQPPRSIRWPGRHDPHQPGACRTDPRLQTFQPGSAE